MNAATLTKLTTTDWNGAMRAEITALAGLQFAADLVITEFHDDNYDTEHEHRITTGAMLLAQSGSRLSSHGVTEPIFIGSSYSRSEESMEHNHLGRVHTVTIQRRTPCWMPWDIMKGTHKCCVAVEVGETIKIKPVVWSFLQANDTLRAQVYQGLLNGSLNSAMDIVRFVDAFNKARAGSQACAHVRVRNHHTALGSPFSECLDCGAILSISEPEQRAA